MAQAWCTGPVHFYCGIASGGPQYLGTTEGRPYIDSQPGWEDLLNDVAGAVVPYDVSFQLEQQYFGGVFTRFRRDTYDRIKTRPRSGNQAAVDTPGTFAPGDVGTLMLTEGQAFQVWMVNAYGQGSLTPKAAFVGTPNGTLAGGVRFAAAWLHKHRDDRGATPNRLTLLFRAIPVYIPATLTSFLYDNNIVGLPAPD